MNTDRITKNGIWYFLLTLGLGFIIWGLLSSREILTLGVLIAAIIFVLFFKNPELALVMQTNGTIIYFYLLYKFNIQPVREITASFHLFLIASCFLGGIYLVFKHQRRIKLNKIDLLFCLFFLWIFLNYFLLYSGSEIATKKILFIPILVLAPYFCIQLLPLEDKIRRFFDYCIILPTIMIIPSFYELITNPRLFELARFAPYITEEGKYSPVLFGTIYAIALLFLLSKIFIGDKKVKIRYFIIIFPLAFLFLRAGGRGSLLSFLMTFFVITFFMKVKLWKRIFLLIFVSALIIFLFYRIPESTLYFYKALLDPEEYVSKPVSSIHSRILLYKGAFKDFLEHPFIGVGLGNSSGGIGFPHNILLEILAELGLLGFMLFLPMLYLTVKTIIRFIREEKDNSLKFLMRLASILFIYSFSHAMFSGFIPNQTRLFASIGLISILGKMRNVEVSKII
jgi:O-antigen ligase